MGEAELHAESSPRFVVGIDLGTTNSAVAFVDTAEKNARVRDFLVPQIVGVNEIEGRDVLPSFHYEPAGGELPAGALGLPWDKAVGYAVGYFARERGAAAPGRLVVSAKSWLSHSGVDRTADLLPWRPAEGVTQLSPVEVSRRYLEHLRKAWDYARAEDLLAQQDVVLTVPASFDEVARELTIEAARGAGMKRVTLLEEPQAAFYAWINKQGEGWAQKVKEGQKILVVDVGGGTTDFSLIRVRKGSGFRVQGSAGKGGEKSVVSSQKSVESAENSRGGAPQDSGASTQDSSLLNPELRTLNPLQFIRVAVGEHLILGGDNLDLALAHHVEKRAKGEGKLDPKQWGPLVRTCRALKETLLGQRPPEKVTVSVAGGGSKLIGGALQVEVSRAEVEEVLVEGFLPQVGLEERPATRRSGFGEFGLPYAADAAITKYLAAFLVAHRLAGEATQATGTAAPQGGGSGDPARPDAILFNGGLFESPVLRERLIEVIGGWFSDAGKSWRPEILEDDRLDLAVARGAAYYGMVRRGKGVRISGGLARSYYIGVEVAARDSAGAAAPEQQQMMRAISILPAGTEEGHEVTVPGRVFELLIRQPVEFPLYYSSLRTTDIAGAMVELDPEQLRELPPIRTVLQSGRKSAADVVRVNLHAKLTEIGTLELWFAEIGGDRTWRLQFDIRATQRSDFAEHTSGAAEAQGVVDGAIVSAASEGIQQTFVKGASEKPESLVKRLEQISGMGRNDWPSSFMRAMWEVLMEMEGGRKLSDVHEARWLNLTGFCLRPGYGLAVDDWRVAQTWRLYAGRVLHVKNELVRAEWWILWRRLAGGLSAGQQQTLAQPLLGAMRDRIRMPGSGGRHREPAYQFGPHETAEVWRCLGSMELLAGDVKAELAGMALDLLAKDRAREVHEAALFALGRFGARVPVYAPLNALMGVEVVEGWLLRLMGLGARGAFATVQLARKTGDRYRDVSDLVRGKVVQWLEEIGASGHFVELVREGGQLAAEEQRAAFGEVLPRGLRIE